MNKITIRLSNISGYLINDNNNNNIVQFQGNFINNYLEIYIPDNTNFNNFVTYLLAIPQTDYIKNLYIDLDTYTWSTN